ncbi:MAG: ABC transporter ATP-binding protein [Myxococcota bacterium]|nr:ABC transporter ATP-binding protein [Myxococcota bacterium]
MIRLRGLVKRYPAAGGSLTVLKGLDLDIAAGEAVAIMGSSGSGKSTLLNVLGLLDGFDEGSYHLNQEDMSGLSEVEAAALRSRTLGFVFQSFNLLETKDAVENVALPLYYQRVPRAERHERARAMLERVGLADRADHRPSQLSGGQKQRVAIARALVAQPKVILADEPTGALDTATTHEIMELLEEVNAAGITLVVVTHEPDIGARLGRTIRLSDGRIVEGA